MEAFLFRNNENMLRVHGQSKDDECVLFSSNMLRYHYNFVVVHISTFTFFSETSPLKNLLHIAK